MSQVMKTVPVEFFKTLGVEQFFPPLYFILTQGGQFRRVVFIKPISVIKHALFLFETRPFGFMYLPSQGGCQVLYPWDRDGYSLPRVM